MSLKGITGYVDDEYSERYMTMDILLEWGLGEVHSDILGLLNDTYFMNGYTSAENK